MPSVALVRAISQRAEGYPSQRGGKAVASLGLGLGFVARPWIRCCNLYASSFLDVLC